MSKSDTRVYVIKQLLDDKTPRPDRYVRARSNIAAMMHVASDFFPARIATHDELLAAMKSGVEVEDAVATKKDDSP